MKKNGLFQVFLFLSMYLYLVSFNVACSVYRNMPQDIYDQQADLFKIVSTELRKSSYAQNVLPHDFSYLQSLIEFGHRLVNRQEYLRSVLSIFTKIMGASHYVNAYAFLRMLEDLPIHLVPYFNSYKTGVNHEHRIGLDGDMFDRFKETVDNLLYIQFSSQYDMFKDDPEQFLDGLAQQVVCMAKHELDTERLRIAIKRFLELNISKLVWSSEEHEQIWDNVKAIAHCLEELVRYEVITDINDLDDMYWTLIHRFNYFLDIAGTELPISFYQNVKHDVYQEPGIPMLRLEEQDLCIQSKEDVLVASLLQAEARRRALEAGMETE